MSLGEVARTALGEIRHHKLRSGLTLLGIILGTLSIIIMTSFLDGIVVMVWRGLEDLGFDGVLYVVGREARDLRELGSFARSKGLQPDDVRTILDRAERIRAAAPVAVVDELVRRGDAERKARIFGTTAAYRIVRDRALDAGRFLSEQDERSFARVCVLGNRLRVRLFGTEDPLGKTVHLGGRPYRVVGVASRLGNRFVNSSEFDEEMEGAYVPLSTLRTFHTGADAELAFIAVKTGDLQRLGEAEAEVIAALRQAHRGVEDFRVENIAEEMLRERQQVTEIIRSWRIVMGALAGISLLVGGIGLISVMLISIGERLYEIGLRKAIGASDAEIFLQFLLEAVVLSMFGGSLGAILGVLVTQLAGVAFPGGLPVHVGGLLLAIGVSVVLGVAYGLYPAWKASRMEPVVALRSAA
jgi:putative ABC transport system permease protein